MIVTAKDIDVGISGRRYMKLQLVLTKYSQLIRLIHYTWPAGRHIYWMIHRSHGRFRNLNLQQGSLKTARQNIYTDLGPGMQLVRVKRLHSILT